MFFASWWVSIALANWMALKLHLYTQGCFQPMVGWNECWLMGSESSPWGPHTLMTYPGIVPPCSTPIKPTSKVWDCVANSQFLNISKHILGRENLRFFLWPTRHSSGWKTWNRVRSIPFWIPGMTTNRKKSALQRKPVNIQWIHEYFINIY